MQGEERVEAQLMALATATSYPPTPDLAAGFWSRLQAPRDHRTFAPTLHLAGAAIAAVIVVLAAVVGTMAPARDAGASFLDRINIFRVDENVVQNITRDIAGEEVTLTEAEVLLGQTLALPTYPEGIEGSITRTLYREFPPRDLRIVAVFFEPTGGEPFVLFATNGFAGKGLTPGANAERVHGVGSEAYWFEGLRIVYLYADDGGRIEEAERATDANTLLWSQDGYIYRIEGELDREEAIAIAQSLQ